MKDKQFEEYLKSYENSCNDIANLFCKKHDFYEIDNRDTYWIADKPGEILATGDFFFDMKDIITDLSEDFEEDALLKWYDYSLSEYENAKYPVTYSNWYKLHYKNVSKI